ncbi:MAG: helix-turn-helix domain-containing protein [Planctomycetota bacterium]
MISVKELANRLSVSAKTVYSMAEEEVIPSYRIGCGRGTLRFDFEEVKRSLRHQPPQSLQKLQRPITCHLQ